MHICLFHISLILCLWEKLYLIVKVKVCNLFFFLGFQWKGCHKTEVLEIKILLLIFFFFFLYLWNAVSGPWGACEVFNVVKQVQPDRKGSPASLCCWVSHTLTLTSQSCWQRWGPKSTNCFAFCLFFFPTSQFYRPVPPMSVRHSGASARAHTHTLLNTFLQYDPSPSTKRLVQRFSTGASRPTLCCFDRVREQFPCFFCVCECFFFLGILRYIYLSKMLCINFVFNHLNHLFTRNYRLWAGVLKKF